VYGFIANILYYRIDTPLKRFLEACPGLVRLTDAVHSRLA